jgi:hypothetical protein
MACLVQCGRPMAHSIGTVLAVAGSLLLGACGPQQEEMPLSAFTGFSLSTGTHSWIKNGGVKDADHYMIVLMLSPPPWDGTSEGRCLAMSSKVVATLDGQVMEGHGGGFALGGCTEPSFVLYPPKDRYGGSEKGDARFVISDATHTMIAEFKDFYVLGPVGEFKILPVLRCDGVAECTASGAQPL